MGLVAPMVNYLALTLLNKKNISSWLRVFRLIFIYNYTFIYTFDVKQGITRDIKEKAELNNQSYLIKISEFTEKAR